MTGLPRVNKEEIYKDLIRQAETSIDKTLDRQTNICIILSLLKTNFALFWVGIYWVLDDELRLGPFQGMVACTKIKRGKGACGMAADEAKTVVLKNVMDFPGYISCHSETRSEIVIPGIMDNKVVFVLDADSTEYDYFDKTDEKYLSVLTDMMLDVL